MTTAPRPLKKNAKSMVTLKDVAGAAGVTSMTVSKVLKGTGRISEATKKRVMQAVADLDYTANPAARMLASGRTGIIAIICGAVVEPYYAQIFHLLHSHLTESGYDVRHIHTENEMSALISATKSSVVDGVIVSGAHDLSQKPEFQSSKLAQRAVFLDTFGHDNVDSVKIDLRGAIETAIERMLTSGRKRIAYCGVMHSEHFDPTQAAEIRLLTYLETMTKHGLPYEFVNSRPGPGLRHAERIAILQNYFAQNGSPDGLFCLSSDIAMLTSRASKGHSEKAQLVSGDNDPFLECFDTSISAIDHRLEEATLTAWQFLKNRIEDAELPIQKAVLEAMLVERESTK